MSISNSDIKMMAHLAKVAMDSSEIEATQQQLTPIFNLITQVPTVDTQGIEPMLHPHDLTQRLREDSVTERNQREIFQAIAPQTERGLYLVPKVIE